MRKTTTEAAKATGRPGKFEFVWRAVDWLPLAIPAALAAFGSVAMLLLLLGQLRNELVWPLGLAAAAAAAVLVARHSRIDRPGSAPEQRLCDLLVIIGVLVWVGFNAFYTSSHVLTNRDPATYAVTAQWLSQDDDVRLDIPKIYEGIDGVTSISGGFGRAGDTIYSQGQHLLPALLGLGGRLVSHDYLHLNVLFGGTALLTLYAFGRLLARPRWAAMVTAAFSVSLPIIYFSRDTYTEPLAATFVFGALALLWHAQRTRRPSLWFLAGLTAGAGCLIRIDAYLTFVGLAAFLAIYLAVNLDKWWQAAKHASLFVLGAALTAVIGWLDVSILSSYYYNNSEKLFLKQIAALALTITVGLLVVWYARRRAKRLAELEVRTRPWRPVLAASVILLAALFFASLPLWYESYDATNNHLIKFIQESTGDTVEPRLYWELAAHWTYWYLGPLLTLIGVVGLAMAAGYASVDKRLLLLPALFVMLSTSALYLVSPSITPDQIWASRRLLPVIMPMVAIFGVVAMSWLYENHLKTLRFKHLLVTIFAAALVVGPLIVSRPFLTTADTRVLDIVIRLCDRLPADSAVLWVGTGQITAVQPTQAFCDIPAGGYLAPGQAEPHRPTRTALAQFAGQAREHGFRPVIALYSHDVTNLLGLTEDDLFRTGVFGYKEMDQTLVGPPRRSLHRQISLMLGEIQPDGSIKTLNIEGLPLAGTKR